MNAPSASRAAGAAFLVSMAALALVLGYAYRWHLALFSMLPGLAVLLGLPGLLVGVVVMRAGRRRGSGPIVGLGRLVCLAGAAGVLQILYFPAALNLRSWEVRRAQSFTEALIPKLEAYRLERGAYPADVRAVLPDGGRLPALLRLSGTEPIEFDNRDFYFSWEGAYGFQFYLPDGFIGFHFEYCCGPQGSWTVTD